MSARPSDFDILPPSLKEPIAALAKAMGYDPMTVVAGWMAHDEIRRLPRDEQSKAIAIVVRLYEWGGKS